MAICHGSNPETGEIGHFYEQDGKMYPSVTTILTAETPAEKKAGLARWRAKNPDWVAIVKKSQVVGTVGHFRVLNSLVDETIELPDIPYSEYPPDLCDLVDIIAYQWEQSGFEKEVGYPRIVESTLISDRYGFAGKADLRCPLIDELGNSQLAIVDLKTSPVVHDSYGLQLAAYGLMMEESPEHAQFPDVGVIVNLCPYPEKNPSLEARVTKFKKEVLLDYAEEFIAMAEHYHSQL
ncbi:MAG: hypothetical protein WCR85_00285 [Sphaerochaeta sp.]